MKKGIFYGLIGFFGAVFLVSGFFLARYLTDSLKSAKTYDDLAQLVEDARREEPTDPSDIQVGQTAPEELVEVTDKNGNTILVLREYAPVFERNNDLVGWIRIPDTKINYPVVQRPSQKDYYLKRDFNGKSSAHGAIYVKEDCDVAKPSDNLTIYGHRMKDGSMFAALQNYTDKAYFQAHPYIRMDSLQEHRTYQILSVFIMSASDPEGFMYHEFVEAEDLVDFDLFVSRCKAMSLYDTGVEAQWGDSFITLSTCEYTHEDGRLVVVAKRID